MKCVSDFSPLLFPCFALVTTAGREIKPFNNFSENVIPLFLFKSLSVLNIGKSTAYCKNVDVLHTQS